MAGLVDQVMTVVVGTILIVALAIPVTTEIIATAGLVGITATIVGYIPLFLAIGGLMLAVALVRGG